MDMVLLDTGVIELVKVISTHRLVFPIYVRGTRSDLQQEVEKIAWV